MPDRSGEESPVYLDHNATTPISAEVVEAMLPYLREHFGNPSSQHIYGRAARLALRKAREQVAELLGCAPDEVLFTSGGTEANNLAIRGAISALKGSSRDRLVTSNVEHPAVVQPLAKLAEQGHQVQHLPVDELGRVRLVDAARAIDEETALVTVMHANNETGTLQPIRDISSLAAKAGALLHTDAAQSVGKVRVDVEELGVDLLSLAGHKLYAPKGVGALYIRRGVQVAPLILGAGHERGVRPGTENVASIVGLGQAAEIARREMADRAPRVRALRDLLWELLASSIDGLKLNGHPDKRLANTLNIRFPGVSGDRLLARAPEVAASTGSACHAGEMSASAVILAMGVAPAEALGSVRLSLGCATSEAEVRRAASALVAAWEQLSERA